MDPLSRRSMLGLLPKAAAATALRQPMTNLLLPQSTPIPVFQSVAPSSISSAGLVTFTFQPVGQGNEAQVSVIVPTSTVGIVWTVKVNGTQIGGTVGNQPFGQFYISGSDVVSVTGSVIAVANGAVLEPNPFNPTTAVLLGTQASVGTLGPTAPTQGGGYPSGLSVLAFGVGGTTPALQPSHNARGIILQSTEAPLPWTTAVSGFLPLNGDAMTLQNELNPGGLIGSWFQATNGTQQYGGLTFLASADWVVYECDFDFDYPNLAQTVPTYALAVPTSAGADWAVTLSAPARLVSMSGQFVASNAAGDRSPYLVGLAGTALTFGAYIPMASAAIAPSGVWRGHGWVGSPMVPTTDAGSLAVQGFTFPEVLLPAGSTIQSITTGIQAADAWSGVVLTFAPC